MQGCPERSPGVTLIRASKLSTALSAFLLTLMTPAGARKEGGIQRTAGRLCGAELCCLTFTGQRYTLQVVIRSFRCADSELLFQRQPVLRFRAFERQALRKLDMLDAAPDIRTLATLPGSRLEALKGGRKGQYSIRINDQWRICFVWVQGHAYDVEIVDYH
jgi:toxin HigB-1